LGVSGGGGGFTVDLNNTDVGYMGGEDLSLKTHLVTHPGTSDVGQCLTAAHISDCGLTIAPHQADLVKIKVL